MEMGKEDFRLLQHFFILGERAKVSRPPAGDFYERKRSEKRVLAEILEG